jgi:hypothetical protein
MRANLQSDMALTDTEQEEGRDGETGTRSKKTRGRGETEKDDPIANKGDTMGLPRENIRTYRNLRVYQAAMDLVMEIFRLSKTFLAEESYFLVDQIRRSSRSVCANLAEAWRKQARSQCLFTASPRHRVSVSGCFHSPAPR